MTFSFAYGDWARHKTRATASDLDAINWMHADAFDITDGWNLSQNTTTAENNMGWSSLKVDDIFTFAALNYAQFAVLMMNVPTSDPNDLTIIENRLNQFIAVGIMPVLRTISPGKAPVLGDPYNEALRALAQRLGLLIIDFSKKILLHRPNGT